jgi:AAA15 family ATPase/GTPase
VLHLLEQNGGGVLLIDELDAHFHPLLIIELLEYVNNKNLPIQIISLNIDSITPENYNEMLLMESFWLLFQGETLLVYNKDSQPLESTLDLVAIDNYVKLENNMSIRNKRAMVERLRTTPPEEGILEHIFFSGL